MNVVWIKRDARLHDHWPLAEAAKQSSRVPCLVLFIYEPEHFESKVFDGSHLQFINEGLAEMDSRLRGVSGGGGLTCRVGDAVEVLSALHATAPIQTLLSHEETGNGISLARNRRVAAWARKAGVAWREFPQSGVVRGLTNRDGWAKRWDAAMRQPVAPQLAQLRLVDESLVAREGLRSAADLGIPPSTRTEAQKGGEGRALDALDAFLRARGAAYQCASPPRPQRAIPAPTRVPHRLSRPGAASPPPSPPGPRALGSHRTCPGATSPCATRCSSCGGGRRSYAR